MPPHILGKKKVARIFTKKEKKPNPLSIDKLKRQYQFGK